MTAAIRWIALVGLGLAASGCAEEPAPIDRVGVNAVEKALFEGSWYVSRTVIDVDYAGSQLGTFPGDIASDAAQSFTALPRIRWVIEEDFLFAYRDYRLVEGTEPDPTGALPPPAADAGDRDGDDVYGEPVAVYAISGHFDIRRQYNPSTGQERNVIEENSTDRPWHERAHMRVDWSKNLLPGYFGQTADLQDVFGSWDRQPADLFAQDASNLPASWAPQFHYFGCDDPEDAESCPAYERDMLGDYEPGQLYHMSFVSQEIMAPGQVFDPLMGRNVNWCRARAFASVPACSNITSYVRTAFLRVSDTRQYEPVNWVDSRFDRFGYFRLTQNVLDRSTGTPDDPAFGYTDLVNYNANLHNIWRDWHDEDGDPVPFGDRDVRQIVWYSTPELPAHLVQPSFDVIAQWNESYMETVRHVRGEALPDYPAVDCQTQDPDGYCFCQPDPQTGDIMQPTCPGRYDPFTAPDDYGDAARPYDCYVEVPDDAEPDLDKRGLSDSDFNGWFGARFVGDECVTTLRINTCNRRSIADNGGTVEGLACEERGDLRFKFLSYVDQPGTRFLGIATLRGDPLTGEIIAGDANIGGPALDSFRTFALETYDLLNGTLDPRDIVTGEDVRGYFERLDRVDLPAQPRTDFTVGNMSGQAPLASSRAVREEIDGIMSRAMERVEQLQGPEGRANVFSDRRLALSGSDIEKRLVSGLEAMALAGVEHLPDGASEDLSEAVLEQVSPFRKTADERLQKLREHDDHLSRANVMMPNEYTDDSVLWFVNNHKDWSRERVEFGLNRLLYRQTQLHEVGHCLGLRHNFGSSADTAHYQSEYYEIVKRFPLPNPADYDLDGTTGLSPTEQAEFERDYAQQRRYRELAGIDGAMNSSVMEYSANWYQRLQPLGHYDHAAVQFAYGGLAEVYGGEAKPENREGGYTYYLGGEVCERDRDCPYATDGQNGGLLLEANRERGLTQRCVDNPRTSGARLCSNFDDDVTALSEAGEGVSPLTYRFCSDGRANATLAWCNRFDEGDTYREIVQNVSESYERSYLFSAFRRYNRSFNINGYVNGLVNRRLSILQNIYNSLIYQYQQQPEFRTQEGAFGFYDQFLATTDVLNFYGRILAQPNVGGYEYVPQTASFVRTSIDPDDPEVDLAVPVGLGRYFNSDYQAGISGIERIERIGSFYDKVFVMQLMTLRGMAASYNRDVAFFTNFYDLFPNEMQQIFSGIIQGNAGAYMPRVVCPDGGSSCADPRVVYMDFYRGDCSRDATCRPNPVSSTYAGVPVLDGGGNISLQIYAALFGLSEFPIYFDPTFQNQLFICVEGQADCHEPDPAAVEGVDYVRYQSDRYRRYFIAFQIEPREGVGEQISIGFEMVKEARNLSVAFSALRKAAALDDDDPDNDYRVENLSDEDMQALSAAEYQMPTTPADINAETNRVDRRLRNLESFFNQMIEFQSRFGIRLP